jgi:predicted RNase H-like HicB family nuclease
MINLPYSLVIEATEVPDDFSFYSPDLEGFTGSGISVDDCLEKALSGMKEHCELLVELGLPVPAPTPDPVVTIRNDEFARGVCIER